MKNWLIPLTVLTVSLATAGGVTAFALSGNDQTAPEADGPDGPASSAVCAPDFPDCNDTIVVPNGDSETGDELDGDVLPPDDRIGDGTSGDVPSIDPAIEGVSEPGIAVGEPYPAPNTSDPKGPAPCEPGGFASITSDGKTECHAPVQVDSLPPVKTPADEDSVRPLATPTLEPGDADAYGREVPIGTFDQDGDLGSSTGSETSEAAPVADAVMVSSDSQ